MNPVKPRHDASAQRAADTPLVAHGELKRGGKGFREQRGTRFAHDNGRQRTCKQPKGVKQSFKTRGHRSEESQWCGTDNVPAPEDHTGRNGNDGSHDNIDYTPLVVVLAHYGRLLFFNHRICAFLSLTRHGNGETSVRRHYPVYVHTVEAFASSQPYGPRVCA